MTSSVSNSKSELRRKILAALEQMSPAARAAGSRALCERLKLQMRSARTIFFFAPMPGEMNLWPLLEEALAADKVVALPRFDSTSRNYLAARVRNLQTDLVAGKLGIREPNAACTDIPLDQFDLILVPGVAFDLRGHRLGRGKGYYDRLLAPATGVKCGVAFDEQIVEAVPVEEHDARMNFIVTPTRCLKCGG